MCGIVGAIALNHKAINVDYTKNMADKIAHRGPDDAGYLFFHTGCRHSKNISFFFDLTDREYQSLAPLLPRFRDEYTQRELHSHDWDIFMGHRRLAILDLSPAGHQPMSDLSKNVWIVYNGEIYNYREIREELRKLGYSFRSNTDTEVIIYAYIEWGIDCIKKFNGMFAFALYDNFKKKFYLARDRYGIKPLYYTIIPTHTATDNNPHTFLFASEIKAILEYKDYKSNIDYEALMEYFTFQNIFTDRTLWKDIKILLPGHYIEIDLEKISNKTSRPQIHSKHSSLITSNNLALNTYNLKLIQYWDFNFTNEIYSEDERELVEELHRLFEQAVERQLVADVEIGSYLSGGMDSGSITAIASNYFNNKSATLHYHSPLSTVTNNSFKTFTIGFDLTSASGLELSFDERKKAEYMSYLFKTEHYEMVLKSGDMERCLPQFAYHLEEPRVGQSYPNFYAAKLASKFVKVVLSGTGGDELFAGYPWRYYRTIGSKNFEEYIDNYYLFWQRLIPNREIKKVFSPIWNKVSNVWTRDIFKSILENVVTVDGDSDRNLSVEDYINLSLYFEAKTFLHGLLVVEDKLSMAHSLETRVPFLDNKLVDFAMKISIKYKMRNIDKVVRVNENEPAKLKKYYQKTNDGKIILRKMMSKYVPEEIYAGEKQGFSSPDNSWFKGESIEFVKREILNKDALIYNFFDYGNTKRLIDEHLTGAKNRRLFIWSLINFEIFLNLFKRGNYD